MSSCFHFVHHRPLYKKNDMKSSQMRQKQKYEEMLKKTTSSRASDSGFEDEREIEPDEAVELTGEHMHTTACIVVL